MRDGARFIEETIRSIVYQGYPNLEYIVVDGGSSDGTVEIIRKYEKHIYWWVSRHDKGVYDALNSLYRGYHGMAECQRSFAYQRLSCGWQRFRVVARGGVADRKAHALQPERHDRRYSQSAQLVALPVPGRRQQIHSARIDFLAQKFVGQSWR